MSKKYWKDSWQYKRIISILEDYWLTEEHEDLVDVRMLFIKGKEYQTKQIRWTRSDVEPEEPKIVNLAEIADKSDKLEKDLIGFIEKESKEMKAEEDDLWEYVWAIADRQFINNRIKKYEQK